MTEVGFELKKKGDTCSNPDSDFVEAGNGNTSALSD